MQSRFTIHNPMNVIQSRWENPMISSVDEEKEFEAIQHPFMTN